MASTSSTSKGFFSPYVTLKMKNGMLIDCRNSMHCIGGTEYCYDEMFTEQGYKGMVDQIPADGAVIFDVGANIGLFALYLAKSGKKNVTCYSFEPIPELNYLCKVNVERSPPENFQLFQVAIGSEEATVDMVYLLDAPYCSTMHNVKDSVTQTGVENSMELLKTSHSKVFRTLYQVLRILPSPIRSGIIKIDHKVRNMRRKTVSVQVRRLSDIIREKKVKKIDLLKVDIEGHEYAALQGIDEEHWPMIERCVLDVERDIEEIMALLKSKGFSVKLKECATNPYENKELEAWRE